MDYRREIDGLRALAVLPVIFFHAGFEIFSGGFVGVDVFFVISGYLITKIVLNDLKEEKFSLTNFYERRARRILPALFIVALSCIPFAWLILLPGDMKDFSESLVSITFFASNILFWSESGYFDTAAELKPLLHTWSLAVEEQYYAIFPLFLMLTWQLGKRWISVALLIIFAASITVAQWAAYANPPTAFYLLPARIWELLIGAFTALYLCKGRRKKFSTAVSEAGGWTGLILILFSVFSYSKTTPFPSLYALVPTLGSALIIVFASRGNTVGKFIGNKTLAGIGLISYSAYLWHQPLIAFYKHFTFFGDTTHYLLLVTLTFCLAYFTWKYIEKPFRNPQILSSRQCSYALAASLLIIIPFGILGLSDGYQSRHQNHNNIYSGMIYYRENYWNDYSRFVNVSGELPSEFSKSNGKNILVIGNSWGHDIANALSSSKVTNVAFEGTTGHKCNEFTHTTLKETDKEYVKWEKTCATNAKRFLNIPTNTDIVVLSDNIFEYGQYNNELIRQAFEANINSIRKNYAGDIFIVKGRPTWKMGGYDIAAHLQIISDETNGSAQGFLARTFYEIKAIDDYYKNFYTKYNVHYVGLSQSLCNDTGVCRIFSGSKILYFDKEHLTLDGSLFISEYLHKKILNTP